MTANIIAVANQKGGVGKLRPAPTSDWIGAGGQESLAGG